jgi:hypothetical protein
LENSDVLLLESVAVAVISRPDGNVIGKVTLKLVFPLPSVITVVEPIKVSPSPLPEGSQAALEKNSSENVVLAVLLSVPWMVVLPPELEAEVNTGKF